MSDEAACLPLQLVPCCLPRAAGTPAALTPASAYLQDITPVMNYSGNKSIMKMELVGSFLNRKKQKYSVCWFYHRAETFYGANFLFYILLSCFDLFLVKESSKLWSFWPCSALLEFISISWQASFVILVQAFLKTPHLCLTNTSCSGTQWYGKGNHSKSDLSRCH